MNSYKSLRFQGILIFFALSALFHLFLFIGFEKWASYLSLRSERTLLEAPVEPMELAYDPELVRQFVPRVRDMRPADEEPEATDEPAKFASEYRQRVKQETRAAVKDFKSPSVNRDTESTLAQEENKPLDLKPSFWGMVTPEDPVVKYAPSTALELPKVSSISVDLPNDIQIGSITVLNTDPMLHFSFFNRFNQLSYHHWVREVTTSYERRVHRGQVIGRGRYSTVVEVILDREGKVLESKLHRRSGFEDFDQAFPKALRTTGQIPNPPHELIESDGRVRFQLLVTVHVQNQYQSRY